MNLEAKVCLFFRRTFPITGSVCAERTAITRPSKFADRKREAVNDEIAAAWDRKNPTNLLTEQLRNLKKSSSGSVKPGAAAQIWEKMEIIPFYKRVPGLFGIHANEFAANTQGDNLRVRHFSSIHISPFGNRYGNKLLVQIVNDGKNK